MRIWVGGRVKGGYGNLQLLAQSILLSVGQSDRAEDVRKVVPVCHLLLPEKHYLGASCFPIHKDGGPVCCVDVVGHTQRVVSGQVEDFQKDIIEAATSQFWRAASGHRTR